jgi:L-lactate dehydrogenase complex protein LldG
MIQTNLSREEILKQIEATRKKRTEPFYPVHSGSGSEIYKPVLPDAVTCFKNELEKVSGKCVLCEDENDVYRKLKDFVAEHSFPYLFSRDEKILSKLEENNIPFSNREEDFENMQAGITVCEFLIARTGSVMVSSVSSVGRQMHSFPPVHIVVADASQMTNYYEDALIAIQQKYNGNLPSTITTITGPSRTADIEKTLVLGAHGPREFIVFISKK